MYLYQQTPGTKYSAYPTSAFIKELWSILEKTLNFTQVFRVVCVWTLTEFHLFNNSSMVFGVCNGNGFEGSSGRATLTV
jgi:hypothetical protein